jgi:hypothetical protein
MADSSSSRTGTQLYMAPELLAGKSASIRSDIYSLGVVLYQLLVGDFKRPVTTDWDNDVADPLLQDDLRHCFAGNPQDRFVASGQLARNLRALPQRRAAYSQRRRSERTSRVRRLTALISVGLAAILLLVAVALAYGLRRAAAESWNARQNLYANDMNLAYRALGEHNLGQAKRLLNVYQQDPSQRSLRGWEWRYLWERCRSHELFCSERSPSVVLAVAFSSDGQTVGAIDEWGNVQILASNSGRLIASAKVSGGIYLTSSQPFSGDGRWLAVTDGRFVRLWDLRDLRQVIGSFEHSNDVLSVSLSPKGDKIATTNGKQLRLLNTTDGREILGQELQDFGWCAYSPDERTLAFVTEGGNVTLLDIESKLETSLKSKNAERSNIRLPAASVFSGRQITDLCSPLRRSIFLHECGSGLGCPQTRTTLLGSGSRHSSDKRCIFTRRDYASNCR